MGTIGEEWLLFHHTPRIHQGYLCSFQADSRCADLLIVISEQNPNSQFLYSGGTDHPSHLAGTPPHTSGPPMNFSHTNLSQFALPVTLILLLIGMYSNSFLDRDLSTARPKQREVEVPPIVSSPGLSGVHARLWDDPLAVCQMHYEQKSKDQNGKEADDKISKQSAENQANHVIIENVRKLICNAKQKKSDEDEKKTTKEEDVGNAGTTGEVGRERKEEEEEENPNNVNIDTLFLPVMLPGGPWAEHHEHRIRIRYAVKAALAESGFATAYADRMSYAVIKNHPTRLRDKTWKRKDIIVPFRLYRFQHDSPGIGKPPEINGKSFQIVVLWVNEQQLGRSPIFGIENIIRQLTGIKTDCADVSSNYNADLALGMRLMHELQINMSQLQTDKQCGNKRDWVIGQLQYTLQSSFRMSILRKQNDDDCSVKNLTDRIHIRIIGPSSSDMLNSILGEGKLNINEVRVNEGCLGKVAITDLDNNASMLNCRATGYTNCIPKKNLGFNLVHVTGKDCELSNTIIKEIGKRYPSAPSRLNIGVDRTGVFVEP
jgi:hypothetical protein